MITIKTAALNKARNQEHCRDYFSQQYFDGRVSEVFHVLMPCINVGMDYCAR